MVCLDYTYLKFYISILVGWIIEESKTAMSANVNCSNQNCSLASTFWPQHLMKGYVALVAVALKKLILRFV